MPYYYPDVNGTSMVADIDEIEAAVAILEDPAAPLRPANAKWEQFALKIDEVMVTGGQFIIMALAPPKSPIGHGKKPFADVPEPLKTRVETALGFFAERYGHSFRPENVEVQF